MPRPVIKTLKFNEHGTDFKAFSKARYILLDSPAPGKPGGTGQAWDWGQVQDIGKETDLILSGGLNPDNVAGAVQSVRPKGVDADAILVGDHDLDVDYPYIDDLREDPREVDLLSPSGRCREAGCYEKRNGVPSEMDHLMQSLPRSGAKAIPGPFRPALPLPRYNMSQ